MLSNYRPRILCVDDSEDCCVMLRSLLALARVEAKTVGTASQALFLMQAERFDLYVMDAWLPRVDGFELCRQIRHIEPHAPILFFSGAGYEADKTRGLEAGASAYVVKPDIGELLRSIKQLVPFGPSPAATQLIPAGLRVPYTSPHVIH